MRSLSQVKACKNGKHIGIPSEHERGIAEQTRLWKDPRRIHENLTELSRDLSSYTWIKLNF